jgi:acyl-CoA dehydrogenase
MAKNAYRVDMREMNFLLWELHDIENTVLPHPPFQHITKATVVSFVDQAKAFADHLGTTYQEADLEGCALLPDGTVRIPQAFTDLWEHYRSLWNTAHGSDEPGDGASKATAVDHGATIAGQVTWEMLLGANPSFMIYGGFTPSAVKLLRKHGTAAQQDRFLPKLVTLEWDACFCTTEPHAGSDVSAIRTAAVPQGNGVYHLTGEKIYISAGMHQLTDNTLYLVLGRGATKGPDMYTLTAFLVPKYWVEDDGTLTPNHIECIHVERKMGLKAVANTRLLFGHSGTTRAYALGDRENIGLLQLLTIMNEARMGTGLFGVALASSAYLRSLEYARQRIQGRPFDQASNDKAGRVSIVEHLDVQRMLLEMKSKVEGSRGLLGKLNFYLARAQIIAHGATPDRKALAKAEKLVQMLTPIVKAYISDQAWRICELAIQVHGGVGYLSHYPIEQYARDVKILSIWEGTNYIQSQDLLRDKLRFGRDSQLFRYYREDIEAFLATETQYPELKEEFTEVKNKFEITADALDFVSRSVNDGKMLGISQYATRFLEMLAEVSMGWVLLEAACVAALALRSLSSADEDYSFYQGKLHSVRFFVWNILPGVATKADIIRNLQRSLIAIPAAEFGFNDAGAGRDEARPVLASAAE